jgi:hypothetical protein
MMIVRVEDIGEFPNEYDQHWLDQEAILFPSFDSYERLTIQNSI